VPDEPVPDCVAQPGRGALVALGHAHNLFMVWTAVIPEWVVPAPMEVVDLHWLAYRVHSDTGSVRCAGISGSLAWVGGDPAGPVIGRTEKPVTAAIARAEMGAAIAVGNDAPPDLERLCAD
jgi:hypothetical protein